MPTARKSTTKAKPKPARKKPDPPGAGAKSKGAVKRRQSAGAKATATKTAAAAKAAGAHGKRLPALKMALRDSLIVQRKAQLWTWETIAAEAGISVRRAQEVYEEATRKGGRVPNPLDADPMVLLEDLARGMQLSIGDFEAMASAFIDANPNVALGAKKAADEARARFAELMIRTGKMPEDLELFRSETEMRRIAEQMVEQIEGVVEGTVDPRAALLFFRSLVMRDDELPLIEA